jgi:predicted GNAT family acetyltransferase
MLNNAIVNRVNVPLSWRGQGIASALMKEVCRDADITKTTLHLSVQPDASGTGLNEDQLLAFYKRNGFISVDDYTWLMKRIPMTER